MSISNYVKFFAENTFDSTTKLEFFQDGGFAIVKTGEVTIYDKNCNGVMRYEGRRFEVLANGVILFIRSNAVSAICNGTKRFDLLKMPELYYHDNSSVIISGSMLLIRECTNKSQTHAVYEVMEDGTFVERLRIPFVDGAILSASDDNSVFAVGKPYNSMRVFNQYGEIELNSVEKKIIKVLACGSFIISDAYSATLFNSEGKLLCDGTSIECINDNFLVFDKKLIILAKNAAILGEYDENIRKIAVDGTFVYSHKIVNKQGVGYMLGGKLMPIRSTARFRPSYSIIWSQNRFYLINFFDQFMWTEKTHGEYISRLHMMKPHK